MHAVPLRLRQASTSLREAAAWLLTGNDPRRWLEELCGWGVPLVEVTLMVLPTDRDDRRPTGVLAVPRRGSLPCVTSWAIPYSEIAPQSFVPVDAQIDPPVSDAELAQLLGDELQSVWHPGLGLVRFEPSDVVRVADLLSTAPPREDLWNQAQPGETFSRKLTAVEPEFEPTLGEILQEGRDDIATEPPTLDRLPPEPGERRGWLRRNPRPEEGLPDDSPAPQPGAAKRLLGAIARAALRLTSKVPRTATRRTWIDSLEDWARRATSRIGIANPFERMREVRRLLHLLETDPLRGLRHAIPFGSEGAGRRGKAPPTNQLGTRDLDFNLDRLEGGGPADFWELPNEYRVLLQQKYRDLAAREVALGRHRRAAFIHAELLGDIPAAAATLAAGRHFREAAVLYRDRLHNPVLAARCLEQGGLLTEAAAIFETQKLFEEAGAIYERLMEHEEAVRCFEQEIAASLLKQDLERAAQLAEVRLADPSRAFEILRGWRLIPPKAKTCLSTLFRLAAQHGWSERVAGELAVIRSSKDDSHLSVVIAQVLAGEAVSYPDEAVRSDAADSMRAVIARRLPESDSTEARALTASLAAAVRSDKLLQRDGERFVRKIEEAEKAKRAAALKAATPRPPVRGLTSHAFPPIRLGPPQTMTLRTQCAWRTAVSAGATYYLAGYWRDVFVVHRGHWQDPIDPRRQVLWKPFGGPEAPILLAPDPHDSQPLLVHLVGNRALMDRSFPPTDRHPRPLPAGSPSWATLDTLAIGRGPNGTAWEVALDRGQGGMRIQSYDTDSVPTGSISFDVPTPIQGEDVQPIAFWAGDKARYVGVGNRLYVATSTDVETLDLRGQATSVAGSARHTLERVAVMHPEGGTVVWRTHQGYVAHPFADGLPAPIACFTPTGWLVAASAGELSVWRTDRHNMQLALRESVRIGTPIAVMPTSELNSFAVFCDSAEGLTITIWRILPR